MRARDVENRTTEKQDVFEGQLTSNDVDRILSRAGKQACSCISTGRQSIICPRFPGIPRRMLQMGLNTLKSLDTVWNFGHEDKMWGWLMETAGRRCDQSTVTYCHSRELSWSSPAGKGPSLARILDSTDCPPCTVQCSTASECLHDSGPTGTLIISISSLHAIVRTCYFCLCFATVGFC